MKKLCALLLLASATAGFAQTNTVTIDDLMQSAQQWASENLDPNVLAALQNADQEKVRQFFDSVQKNFQGDYVLDLAQLRGTAQTVLPLLESYEETAPYGAWLKTRMDYLDTAEELRLRIPPPKNGNASRVMMAKGATLPANRSACPPCSPTEATTCRKWKSATPPSPNATRSSRRPAAWW